MEAIKQGVDGLRINPGNIGSIDRVRMVVEKAKEKNIKIIKSTKDQKNPISAEDDLKNIYLQGIFMTYKIS